ncbi:p22 protein precursor [Trypanosoma equiperdum]|uniref:p22 protein n=2 Tax=Trypanozoon TaxID=39700 RepID=Q584R4_TRYB2|nr:p22 protein precursor [Trypanosoma brucei brucei TREU927]AAX80874.1 p22 protein precursor [Trypanosoma brucei]AAZ11804.1 p22 protein precursor [Trypanosoma brucei brucei TREU927]SCU71889.1 p22 protein precursor [Trypanosoma equiperdum]
MRRALVFTAFAANSAAAAFAASFAKSHTAVVTNPTVPQPVYMQQRLVSDQRLSEATLRELEDERQRAGLPEKPEIPEGWTIDRKPGVTHFTMRKSHGDEEIILQLTGEDRSNEEITRTLDVLVVNGGKALVFGMSVEDGEFVINNVCFRHDGKLALDTSAEAQFQKSQLYMGPDLADLEDHLVDSFTSYLSARGVNDTLANFIDQFSLWSEQADYEEWLSSINKFVS